MIGIRTMMNSNRYWRGLGIDAFLKWLGLTEKKAKQLNFASMARLPILKKYKVYPLGGGTGGFKPVGGAKRFRRRRRQGLSDDMKREFVFWWAKERSGKQPETFRGKSVVSYDHAAMHGLITLYELTYYRETQSEVT